MGNASSTRSAKIKVKAVVRLKLLAPVDLPNGAANACLALQKAVDAGDGDQRIIEHAVKYAKVLVSLYTKQPKELPVKGMYGEAEFLYELLEERPGGKLRPVRLVRCSWILERAEKIRSKGAQWRMPRRQQLEKEEPDAFLGLGELKRLKHEHGGKGKLAIASLSYCWLTPEHPDPEGAQLVALADKIIKAQSRERAPFPAEAGFFIDFLSLCQKDEAGERTEDELEAFRTALSNMQIWYAHANTTAFLARQQGASPAYDARGWTTCESNWSMLIKRQEGGCTNPIFAVNEDKLSRRAPIGPVEVARQVAQRRFTSRSTDLPMVIAINVRTILSVFRDAKVLFYSTVGWGDAEAVQLAEILPLCSQVTDLWVTNNNVGDEGIAAIARWIGTSKTIQSVLLYNNPWGDRGADALCEGLRANTALNGGTPSVMSMRLYGTQVSSQAKKRLAKTFRECGTEQDLR